MDKHPLYVCWRSEECVFLPFLLTFPLAALLSLRFLTLHPRPPRLSRVHRLLAIFPPSLPPSLPLAGIDDLPTVDRLSHGKVDITYGSCVPFFSLFSRSSLSLGGTDRPPRFSAVDIFGGKLVKFDELVAYNKKALEAKQS